MNLRIGFVGYGEVGYNFSLGLKEKGLGVAAFDRRREQVSSRAGQAGVELVSGIDSLVRSSDVVISAVWPDTALDVAKECAKYLGGGQTYIDVNNVSPRTVGEMGGRSLRQERISSR